MSRGFLKYDGGTYVVSPLNKIRQYPTIDDRPTQLSQLGRAILKEDNTRDVSQFTDYPIRSLCITYADHEMYSFLFGACDIYAVAKLRASDTITNQLGEWPSFSKYLRVLNITVRFNLPDFTSAVNLVSLKIRRGFYNNVDDTDMFEEYLRIPHGLQVLNITSHRPHHGHLQLYEKSGGLDLFYLDVTAIENLANLQELKLRGCVSVKHYFIAPPNIEILDIDLPVCDKSTHLINAFAKLRKIACAKINYPYNLVDSITASHILEYSHPEAPHPNATCVAINRPTDMRQFSRLRALTIDTRDVIGIPQIGCPLETDSRIMSLVVKGSHRAQLPSYPLSNSLIAIALENVCAGIEVTIAASARNLLMLDIDSTVNRDIESIPFHLLVNLRKLRIIMLTTVATVDGDCIVKALPRMSHLYSLELQGIIMSSIHTAYASGSYVLPNLTKLHLAMCDNTIMHDYVYGLTSLTDLCICSVIAEEVVNISPKIGNLTGLTKLRLVNQCKSLYIPQTLCRLTALKALDLPQCQLMHLHADAIHTLATLGRVDMADLEYTSLYDAAVVAVKSPCLRNTCVCPDHFMQRIAGHTTYFSTIPGDILRIILSYVSPHDIVLDYGEYEMVSYDDGLISRVGDAMSEFADLVADLRNS